LTAGIYETRFHADAKVTAELFRRRGQPVREVYVHQGHSFGAWRELSVDMLAFFFGTGR
jgi:enterochelin esterase-like enzyme